MNLPYQSVSRRTTNSTNEEDVMSDFRLLINGRLVKGAGTLGARKNRLNRRKSLQEN
jgi:hypothetical protein